MVVNIDRQIGIHTFLFYTFYQDMIEKMIFIDAISEDIETKRELQEEYLFSLETISNVTSQLFAILGEQ